MRARICTIVEMNWIEENLTMNRRQSLSLLGLASLASSLKANASEVPHIATNTYPWSTFARREGEKLTLHTDSLLSDIANTGIAGYEPIINSPDEFVGLAERLQKHQLEMRSLYVNSTLHDKSQVEASVASVVAIATAAKALGTKIIVTNPSPIKWGGDENKSDEQLKLQAESLDYIGEQMRKNGQYLAYHNHDAELRQGAREFHHMLTATNPDNVKFCLDSHWVFRGCGNSQVALFDAVQHYADRIVELHLRQSKNGVWTEAFSTDGDIDYARLFQTLSDREVYPHLVLEQAVESGSPNEHSVTEAHRLGSDNLRKAVLQS